MAPHRSIFRPSYQVIVAALALAAVLTVSFAYDQWTGYRDTIARAERDARNVTVLIAEHTARSFEAVEEALLSVARVHRDVVTSAIPNDAGLIHQLLKAVHGTSPLYFGVGWVDAGGNIAATSRFSAPPRVNIAGQEHFRIQRDSSAAGLHISKTIRSIMDGQPLINTSIRLVDVNGSFAGIAAASVNVAHLAQLYEKIDLGPNQVVTVFRTDGALLVRTPNNLEWIGADFGDRPLFRTHLPRADSGIFYATAPLDGIERLVSYVRVPGLPLVVAATLSRDDILATFRRQLATSGARMGAMLVVLALGTWLLVRQMRRHDQLETDLRESEARFRDYASSSGDWFWETDENHRFVWISASIDADAGGSPAWRYGKTRRDLAAAGNPPALWDEHERTLNAHLPFRDFEYIGRNPTGDRRTRVSGLPVFDEEGRFRGYRGSGRDVTELRRAEQRLRDAVEAIPGGFMLFDADDRLVYVNSNDAGVAPTGRSFAKVGETFENILRATIRAGRIPEAQADPEAWLAERLQQHRAATGTTLLRVDGRVTEVIERPTQEGGVVMLRFDVTEREFSAEAQRQARDASDAANRAKSEFLSRMSHELRTPLNAILGFAQMLQIDRSGELTGRQKEYTEFIVNGGEHLLNLVNEVLDLAGVEAGRMKLSLERIELADILVQSVETMRPVARKSGIVLTLTETGTHVDVRADALRLRQILLNLLSNAIKYNRPEGSVSVSASLTMGERVRIAVADTGIGIAAEHAGQLFEPFNRLGAEHTSIEGTGIGLALSKRLVEAMDGTIGYTSEPGRGSTFWIELPLSAPAALPGPAATLGSTAPLTAAGGYRLLYVEDNTASLRLMQHLIGALPNVAMLSAPDGRLGLDLAAAHRPDVIVLDLNLPGMNGYEILRRLHAMPETCDVPVIALSAAAMPSDIKRGMAAGFFRYLTKPLEVNAFLAAVDEALATRRQRAANDG